MKLKSCLSFSISKNDVFVIVFALAVWVSSIYNGCALDNSYLLPLVSCYFAVRVLNKLISSFSEILVLLLSLYCDEQGTGSVHLSARMKQDWLVALTISVCAHPRRRMNRLSPAKQLTIRDSACCGPLPVSSDSSAV